MERIMSARCGIARGVALRLR